jgi:dipicolinate synthase subunit A
MAEFIIYQTDERMFFLRNELSFSAKKRTHIFAPNILLGLGNVAEVGDHEVVIGGRADEEVKAHFNSTDVKYFNMLEDEKFQARNSRLTAEGTLNVVLSHSLMALDEMSVLVIGFGRTGAAVARILRQVGVKRLTVATTASLRPAYAFADEVIPVGSFDFAQYDTVINTVPQHIIDDKAVLTFSPSALYIDLATKPALNLCFAKYLGIDAEIYPALPAKTAPLSAARAIKDYVLEVTK